MAFLAPGVSFSLKVGRGDLEGWFRDIKPLQVESEIPGAPNLRRLAGFPIYATGNYRIWLQ